MGVKDSLLTVPQREEGGRTAYDRFDYQTAWGLSRLLDLHAEGKNYAVAFEFHDDIVSLDDADAPSSAVFYQVKTKLIGNWSFAKISHRGSEGGKKKASFAGKMFDNFVKFGAVVERLAFVSNQPLPDVIVVHGEECFSKADKANLTKFVQKLAAEVDDFKDPLHISLFFFCFSPLNLTNYEDTVVGRIAEFLENEHGASVPARAFALVLNDYCRKKSKRLADVGSFDQLKASKFVTRSDVMKWLAQARSQHERRPEWQQSASELDLPFSEKIMVERAWRDYEVALRSRPNAATVNFTVSVRDLIDAELSSAESLVELVDLVFPSVKPLVIEWKSDCTDAFVKAAILYELKR